jgi:hypothetical protein
MIATGEEIGTEESQRDHSIIEVFNETKKACHEMIATSADLYNKSAELYKKSKDMMDDKEMSFKSEISLDNSSMEKIIELVSGYCENYQKSCSNSAEYCRQLESKMEQKFTQNPN